MVFPHFNVGTWTPKLTEDFLKHHGFKLENIDGHDALWLGKDSDGKHVQVAFPVRRRQLTPGTMRDSVMNQSGYSKKHWDYWRSLRKHERKQRNCCKIKLDS